MFRRTKPGAKPTAQAPASPLAPGTEAPSFTLPATEGERLSLSKFRGQPVVLVFYPADWSPVCGDQLTLYNEVLPLFEEHQAQVLAISVDGIWCHRAFAENRNLRFPLLTDFEPKGAVARAYGVYDAQAGTNKRALFVIDGGGIIHWSYVSPSGVNPGADGILTALESL
jgi:peroxiredoxin